VLAALSLLGLGIFGPGIANGIVSGGPQLGAGSAVGTSLAAGGMMVAGGALAARGGSAALAAGSGAVRGSTTLAGGAATSYSLGSSGQSGASGVAAGLGGVARAAGGAMTSPLRRASAGMRQSYTEGGRAAIEATGGAVTAATSTAPGGTQTDMPDWARRMKRAQRVSHGASAAAHSIRSGDAHGGGSSIDLSEGDR
ncbi:MAG: P-type conjugative transfer protein TrbL, partial [Rhodobiaceae bacterium]|nr:P-type conjugative transfer protein TrbL [Rhodobiaceae bacterium]